MSSGTRPQLPTRRGVRVVGKIRPREGDPSASSCHPWISVARSSGDHALLTFSDQASSRKECYKLDWCYEQDEGVDEIFAAEVKPLLQGVFHGTNACVIALGARGSGKTQVIQGSEGNPGLAPVAVSKILSFAQEKGGSVAISCFDVVQDHLYDVLEPKEQEVLILEDASRRIQLKGLSQVPVKSVSDFNKLYFSEPTQRKPLQKVADESTTRSHRGLIVFVYCADKENNNSLVGKMSFIDLAGYEDIKQRCNARYQLAENTKVNKSIYALLNVVYAQNANEAYVPYRESKLTRLLQDFVCRTSCAMLITCLKPTVCQDTIHAVTLASRSSQVANQHRHDSAKKIKSNLRVVPSCSPSNGGSQSLDNSVKKPRTSILCSVEKKGYGTPSMTKGRTQTPCTSVKKPGMSRFGSIERKASATPIATKGRKLFNGTSPSTNSLKDNLLVSSVIEPLVRDEVELSVPDVVEPSLKEEDVCPPSEQIVLQESDIGNEFDAKLFIRPHDSNKQNENETPSVNTVECSPPLSERLREISNTLKLISTQPLSIKIQPSIDVPCTRQENEDLGDGTDPKTPGVTHHIDNQTGIKAHTPQVLLKTRSTGLKKSLVQECLAFLNCANKEELQELKGIGEKRATYILQLREDNLEPFKDIDDIHKHLGLSSKQIGEMMTRILGEF